MRSNVSSNGSQSTPTNSGESPRGECVPAKPPRHVLLVASSPPYSMPVQECHMYAGNTADQLAILMLEVINNLLRF